MVKKKKAIEPDDRNISFPSETLTDCVEIVSQIVKRKGETTVPFKDIAIILGKPISNTTLPVSSCTQYGLLENIHGSGYKATDLFNKIEMPVFESDKRNAILDALSNAPLYNIIIEKFNGKILPDEQGMGNLLTKEFGIKSYIIQKVVKTFYRNFRDADLIDNNNRLRFLASTSQEPTKSIISNENNSAKTPLVIQQVQEALPSISDKLFEQAIDLGDATAYLKYPRKLNHEQVSILRIHLEATLQALEKRNKKNDETKKEQPEGHSSTTE